MDNSPSLQYRKPAQSYRNASLSKSKPKIQKAGSSITYRDSKLNVKKEKLPRNVNDYSHIIHGSMKNEGSLQWVLKLRNDVPHDIKRSRTIPNAPSCYESIPSSRSNIYSESCNGIHIQRKKLIVTDVESVNQSANEVMHLARHRIGGAANVSQLTFETGLRGYAALETAPKQPEWNNIPYRDRAHETSIK